MNRVQQPRTLLVRGLNAGMSTAAGADELVEILTDAEHPAGTKAHLLHLSCSYPRCGVKGIRSFVEISRGGVQPARYRGEPLRLS